ncbi:MAG: helix-hairpin-helix domain-containing protein [Cyclobacteriaceae bacterium]
MKVFKVVLLFLCLGVLGMVIKRLFTDWEIENMKMFRSAEKDDSALSTDKSRDQPGIPRQDSLRESSLQQDSLRQDSLRKISGIGPDTEQKLNSQGILSIAQLASMNENELEKLREAAGISPGLASRYDWIGEARLLQSRKGHA